jgi:hypothetical protein
MLDGASAVEKSAWLQHSANLDLDTPFKFAAGKR